MSTGKDLLISELERKGFSVAKIKGNMSLIEAVISILSDEETRKQIDLAEEIRADAQRKLFEAESERGKAQNERNEVIRDKWKNEEILRQIEEKRKDLEQKQQRLEEGLQVETAEARDRVRLYHIFMNDLPEDTRGNQNAVIYGAAAILSGQTVFTAATKTSK